MGQAMHSACGPSGGRALRSGQGGGEAGYHCLPGREVCSRNAHNRHESYIPHLFGSAQIHVASSSLQTLHLKAPSVCYICKHSCFLNDALAASGFASPKQSSTGPARQVPLTPALLLQRPRRSGQDRAQAIRMKHSVE